MPAVNPFEMIAYTGSRVLEDETIVFVGTGLPIIAAMHAQLTHAPNLHMIFEAGSLAAGTYYVFGDSEGPMSHAVEITTGPACAVTNVTAPTDENQLRHLMATITLPAGTVTPESGQLVGVDKSGPAINCVSGEDGGP